MNSSPNAFPEKGPSSPVMMDFVVDNEDQSATLLFNCRVTAEDFKYTLNFLQPDAETSQRSMDTLLKTLVEDQGLIDKKPVRLLKSQTDFTDNARLEEVRTISFRERPTFIELTDTLMQYYDDEEEVTFTKNQIIYDAINHGAFGDMKLTITTQRNDLTITDEMLEVFLRDLES